jgi:uncharacterized membrane protein YhaH (DUF805 family)
VGGADVNLHDVAFTAVTALSAVVTVILLAKSANQILCFILVLLAIIIAAALAIADGKLLQMILREALL